MNSWQVIYEYCYNHTNCTDSACTKTVLIQAIPEVPFVNLLPTNHTWGPAAGFLPRTPTRGPLLGSPSARVTRTLFNTKRISKLHSRSMTFRMPVPVSQFLGLMLLALGLGGIVGPFTPNIRLEAGYIASRAQLAVAEALETPKPELPKSVPVVFEPLKAPDGSTITPASEDFSIIVPKIGINAPVVANVDPAKPDQYDKALLNGVAQASTSFLPDQNGTVYLFSHSTNYDWFVKDLNAVFYLVKNLDNGDLVILIYKGVRYSYQITDKQVVSSTATQYLVPSAGKKNLILETCWPPGSTAQRLLIFANLVDEQGLNI